MGDSLYNIPFKETSSHQEIPWQATNMNLILELKDKVLAAIETPGIVPQLPPKELTVEAMYMIFVMLIFVLLTILGSSLTLYEIFFHSNRKATKSYLTCYKDRIKKEVTRLKPVKNSLKRVENVKSFLKCFCMIKNGRKILNTLSSEDQIDFIQGMRFIGSTWVICFHTGILYFLFLKDVQQSKHIFEMRSAQLILNGHFSVDQFFVISGFLNSYLFYRVYNERHTTKYWIYFYFKRFIRLTPVYMIVLGFYTTMLTYTGSGIVWPTYDSNPVCKKDWWRYFFYINNFEKSQQQCMGLYWSLAADMQFYIISPLFMISFMRCRRLGYFLVLACIAGSCVASFLLTYHFNLCDGLSRFMYHLADIRYFQIKFWEYFDTVHTKPYTRISAYLVGISLGYFLNMKIIKENPTRNNKETLYFGWLATISSMWICFCWIPNRKGDILMDTAFYNGTKFLLFSSGIAWIMYVCLTGQAETLKNCLSWKVLIPLGRLSYCAYLVHPIIIARHFLQAENVLNFNVISMKHLVQLTNAGQLFE